MANVEKLTGRKGRRSDNKTETGKADTLNFALTAGAVGLGLALLDLKQAAAAGTDSKSRLPDDDDRKSDSSVSADQATLGIEHSKTVDHPGHGNRADGGPAVANGEESGAQIASSESSHETMQQVSESASSLAAATGDAAHATAVAPTDAGISASVVHANSEAGEALEGAHGASSVISSAIATVAPSDGALGGAGKVLEIVDGVTSSLLGNGGLLPIAPVLSGAVQSLIGKDGLLGTLTGEHNGDVVVGLADTGHELVEGLGDTVNNLVDNAGGGIVGGILSGGHGGILGGLLGSGSTAGEAVTASNSAASTGTQAHVDPGAASNFFEVAHSALQITEGVADVITPILTFVGQPFIEDDAHTDADHASNASTHHA